LRSKAKTKGRLHLVKREFNEAISLFQPYLTDNPKSARGHYFLALAQLGNGDVQQAKTSLTEAIKINPKWDEARLLLGDLHLRAGAFNLPLRRPMKY